MLHFNIDQSKLLKSIN